ncbi:MAG: hypothetical protein NC923_03495, partial [Candidatus Omnitrophica bacterium]|nr:hypothetical protein [Candidatus Omnitrophota bacterium]
MKILIVYASAGSGHRKAAEAIYNYFKKSSCGDDILLVDALTESCAINRFLYTTGYRILVTYLVFFWRWGFWLTKIKSLRFFAKAITGVWNQFNSRGFLSLLIRENPDVVVSTHFLPSGLTASLKLKNKINSKLYTVITDFGLHPFWLSEGTDYYVVACRYTKDLLLREGIAGEKIREFGIPVDEKFLRRGNRRALACSMGLDADKFTVLLMTGSFGIGPLEKIARMLHRDAQIIVICAGNKKLYHKLNRMYLSGVLALSFVDNPQDFMSVSDVIITKPGGLTLSEIVAMELAPVFVSAIPGQEVYNQEIFRQYGAGIIPDSIRQIKDIILDFKNNPDKLEEQREAVRRL